MGRYVIDRVFAEGAQGRLYRAKDVITNQICILKTGESVKKEALLAVELNHPYIARPFDYGIDPEIGAYAAYPEYSDPSLLEWKEKKAKKDDLRRVALQIAEFLAFLHHRGWLYNDFKPGHFLISEQSIKVLDLGLCSRIDETSSTFSGTFPYIAPERLAGRPCDGRSDIFALGMMLLHTLLPQQTWEYEPSLEVLHEISKRTEGLSGFWKNLLSEMTSLEPAQRIETATELWHRLLIHDAGNFLFFPIPSYFSVPRDAFENEPLIVFQSASHIILAQAGNNLFRDSWENNISTKSYDLSSNTVEECYQSLCQTHLGEGKMDFFSAISSLKNLKLNQQELVHFNGLEMLSPQQRALFSYGLSNLLGNGSFRFLITTTKEIDDLPEEGCKKIVLPNLTRQDVGILLGMILPPNGKNPESIEKFKTNSYSVPEQLIADFRKELSSDQYLFWPVAAKDGFQPLSIEKLRPIEMRALGCFAVSGGSLHSSIVISALRSTESQGVELLGKLEFQGYLQRLDDDKYFLTVPAKTILDRLRKDRVKQIAEAVLRSGLQGKELVYQAAHLAGQDRKAAVAALKLARGLFKEKGLAASLGWFWRAFQAGAKLPKPLMYTLVRASLRRVEARRIRLLSRQIRKRYGMTYSLADLTLDLLHRTNKYKIGVSKARIAASTAMKCGTIKRHDYFMARYGGFLILDFQLDEGEIILTRIVEKYSKSNSAILGLAFHFLGLSHIYRGKFGKALNESKHAARIKHHHRNTSLMNVGVTLIRLGRLNESENWIRKAIKAFSLDDDVDRLSYAYNNLGITLKYQGRIKEARNSYFFALQLARICKNIRLRLNILANLGVTYESEGRTHQAIKSYSRASSLARKSGFPVLLGMTLINAALQYSILGHYKRSIARLTKALKIVSSLDLKFEMGSAYESLGVTYLLSHHYRKSISNLGLSISHFSKAGADKDRKRAQIFLALALAETGSPDATKQFVDVDAGLSKESFEYALTQYVFVYSQVHSTDFDRSLCRERLHEAETGFRKLPNLFWLGKLHILKAQYFAKTEHYEKVNISLQSAYNIFLKLGAQKELMNLSKQSSWAKMPTDFLDKMAERLPYKILLMIKEVLSEPDPDQMITKILSASLEFTDMERAVLILKEDPPRIFKSASLEEATIKEIYDISNSAMDEATDSKKPYVRLDAVTDPYLKSKPSILASRIMSIVCLPLRANDRPIGVLYLDSREGVETLASTETVLLEIFAAIISLALNNSLVLERSIAENEGLRASLGLMQFPEIIGRSEPMMKVLKIVNQLLGTELPVLITGETGTGKEMIARVLHFSGKRKNNPFLAVNCSAISKDLLESELFGHEKGSFTGAVAQKKGLFEQARGGTLFLDEIGEMPYSMQAKLLRVLQEGEFRRVGGNETLHTDVRLVLATNRNLQEMVKQERFRQDLFYRIKGAQVHLPALRERPQDIPLLISNFLDAANKASGRKIAGFIPETLDLLKQYSWPGNIRQLKNEVERVVALAQTDWIKPEDLDEEVRESQKLDLPLKGTLRERERQFIADSLEENNWNIVQTAKSLGLTRNGLYGKMKLHGIPRKSVE